MRNEKVLKKMRTKSIFIRKSKKRLGRTIRKDGVEILIHTGHIVGRVTYLTNLWEFMVEYRQKLWYRSKRCG